MSSKPWGSLSSPNILNKEPFLSGPFNPQSNLASVADRFLEAVVENGVDCVFLNPGTDTAPILESLARRMTTGKDSPRLVLCLHEAVALAAAHGYYMVTGRPQLVVVHVDVGTQNLGAMLHNVWRGQIGVVIFAGRTPLVTYGGTLGRRDLPVHWQQDVPDQDGIVRPYVKLVADLRMPELIDQQVHRAFQVAAAVPPGATYLTAGRELLMLSDSGAESPTARARLAVPTVPGPTPESLAQVVRWISEARRPVLTTTRVGRDPAAVPELVALAERIGSPVVDRRERLNFPWDHPLYIREPEDLTRAIREADLVIDVDSDVPWVPSIVEPSASARIVRIETDPLRQDSPNWSFPADIAIQSDPVLALRMLNEALERAGVSRVGWLEQSPTVPVGLPPGTASVMTQQQAIEAIAVALSPEDIVIEEVTTSADAMRRYLPRTMPGTHFQSGGSGLGWSIGAALGVKLATPDRRVVAILGDGAFMFNNPSVGLWVSIAQHAPTLVVVLDNGGYAASRKPIVNLYPDGAYAGVAAAPGTAFNCSPDFVGIARASGYLGHNVSTKAEFEQVLATAVADVDAGRGVLIVAQVSSPWLPEQSSTHT